jgi:hypothetical protein
VKLEWSCAQVNIVCAQEAGISFVHKETVYEPKDNITDV